MAYYSTLTIKFFDGLDFVTLQGDSQRSTSVPQAQYHHLRCLHHIDAISAIFTLQPHMSSDAEDPLLHLVPTLPFDILVILRQFLLVFTKPHGLPPSRSHDHAIPLLPNVPPVKVRPYWYPFSYKTEIEKIVCELL